MLKINDILLTKGEVPLGFIRDFYLKSSSDSLVMYAETIDITGIRTSYVVNSIKPIEGSTKLRIDLRELDFSKVISESEKIVDIRDFKRN